MDIATITAFITSAGALVSILACIFMAGKLSQKVDSHTEDLAAHAAEIREHRAKIAEHDVDLGKIQQWREGFHLGAQLKGQDQ